MNEEVERGEERRTDFSVPLNSPTHFPFRVPLRPPRSRVTTERARERGEQILSPSVPLSICAARVFSEVRLPTSRRPSAPPRKKVRVRLHEHPCLRALATLPPATAWGPSSCFRSSPSLRTYVPLIEIYSDEQPTGKWRKTLLQGFGLCVMLWQGVGRPKRYLLDLPPFFSLHQHYLKK